MTDAGVIALSAGCSKLRDVHLACCYQVADAGVIALGAGYGQMEVINLESCYQVSETCMSALDHIAFHI